jgi:hypothetical protein
MSAAVAATVGYTESGAASTSHVADVSALSLGPDSDVILVVGFHAAAPVYPAAIVVTDGAGNEWEQVVSPMASGSTVGVCAFRCLCELGGPNTVTITTPTAFGVAARFWKVTGARSWGLDGGQARAVGSSTSPTSTPQPPAFATGLSFGAIAAGASTTFTSPTFTTGAATARQKDSSSTTSSVVDLESGYRTQSNTTAQAYSATISSQAWAALTFTLPASDHEVVDGSPEWGIWERGGDPVPTTGQLWPRGVA